MDKFIENIIKKLETAKTRTQALDILFETPQLKMENGVLFRYEEYTIQNLFKTTGGFYEKNLVLLNKLNLNIIPKHIKTVTKGNEMFIICKIEETKQEVLKPFDFEKENIPKENLIEAFDDLKTLSKNKLIDDSNAFSTANWFVAPDNKKIILPIWNNLRELKNDEIESSIEKYRSLLCL